MKPNLSVFIQLFLASAFLFIAGCSQPHPAADYPEPFRGQLFAGDSLIDPTPQVIEDRIFEEAATERLFQYVVTPDHATADTPADRIMALPLNAVVDSRESVLYVMSVDSLYINKYDISSGDLQQVITSPREKWTPSAYLAGLRIISDDLLWIYGIEKAKVYEMDSNGELGKSIDMVSGGGDMTPSLNGNVAKITSHNSDYLFHIFSATGEEKAAFGILSSERMKHNGKEYPGHGLGFAGQVISDGSDTFVYVANSAGKLLQYDMDGRFLYYRETIQTNSYPASVPSEGNHNVIKLDTEGIKGYTNAVNIWDGVLYTSTFVLGEDRHIIDAYEYATGDYLYSFYPPENSFPTFITSDHLYAVGLDGVFQMKRGREYRISNKES